MSSSRSCHYLSTLLDKFSRGPVKITSDPRTRRNKSGVIWRWSEQATPRHTEFIDSRNTRRSVSRLVAQFAKDFFYEPRGRAERRKGGEERKKGKSLESRTSYVLEVRSDITARVQGPGCTRHGPQRRAATKNTYVR